MTNATGTTIPVVDFSSCSLLLSELELKNDAVSDVAERLVEGFSSTGFVYLRHCGVSTGLLKKAFSCSKEFFHLKPEIKRKYQAVSAHVYQGYMGFENEIFDTDIPGDLKESFEFCLGTLNAPIWPSEVSMFKDILFELFKQCAHLSERILKVLTYGLGLDDHDFFSRCHNILTMDRPYGSTFRTLHYPPIKSDAIKEGQRRLGEHTDWGTISLVFQDDAGGLQVRGAGGQWIDAEPIEGTVLVNIADMLQRWTSDRLTSTAHRIVVSKDGIRESKARQSLAFFVHPDPDFEIRCLDGSEWYGPLKYGEYMKQKLIDTRPGLY